MDNAIKLQPNYTETYYNRGVTYDKLGQYLRAIEDYNKAFRLNPDYAKAYNNWGINYLSQGNKKIGCFDAQKACIFETANC